MMKIAIIGTRGIPNQYGGFEQLAEMLAVKLVQKGCDVTVYNSSLHRYNEETYNGVKIITCKDPEDKFGTFGQFVYDFNCIMNSRKHNFDIVLQLGYTSSSIWNWLIKKNAVIVTNMDGLEWKRSKYNFLTKKFLKIAEELAVKNSHKLVADSIGIKDYLRQKYGCDASHIAYGSEIPEFFNEKTLKEFKVSKNNYFLVIARLEPENNVELILNGYLKSDSKIPIVVIGSLTTNHAKYLVTKFRNDSIKFIGALYNQEQLNDLRHFCNIYFHGHSVGGTNPSLIEAMAAQANICAYNTIFNESVLEYNASYFESDEDIKLQIRNALNSENNKEQNLIKVRKIYNWDNITVLYHNLFRSLVNRD